jgi:2-C-methyl-D-erythritol 4-phosphate cytidylyltransferase
VEAAGHPVVVVAGSPVNFKITTRDDLELAEAIVKARLAKPSAKPPTRFDDEAKW